MVRELHRAGIEVILDVVYNHTGEGNEQGPSLCFKGILDLPQVSVQAVAGRFFAGVLRGHAQDCRRPGRRGLQQIVEQGLLRIRRDAAGVPGDGIDQSRQVRAWLQQIDARALKIVQTFLGKPGLDADLRLKVLETVDDLERTVRIRAKYARAAAR